tara:strand:+ start:762 stop:1622 length:861 start_codon:yes stop_codon:yes gene_type:complete
MGSELEVGKLTVENATLGRGFFKKAGAKSVEIGAGGTGSYVGYDSSGYLEFASITGVDAAGYSAKMKIDSTGAVSIPSAAGTQIALTVKGGSNLVDHIALNLTNQAGDTGTNIRNNGQLFATALATFSGGIAFGQTNSAAAGVSDDSTTLSHYESGSWSPTLYKGTIGGTLTQHTGASVYGKYVRIGNLVWISFYILQGAGGTQSASGQWVVKGLPFTVKEGAAAGHQSIPSNYFQLNGTNFFNASPHRWQANATDALQMYGTQNATAWSSGAMEFGGSGVLHIDY